MSITRVLPKPFEMGNYPEESFDERKIKPGILGLSYFAWDRIITCKLSAIGPDDPSGYPAGKIVWIDTVEGSTISPGGNDYGEDVFNCREDAVMAGVEHFIAVFYYDSEEELQELMDLCKEMHVSDLE